MNKRVNSPRCNYYLGVFIKADMTFPEKKDNLESTKKSKAIK